MKFTLTILVFPLMLLTSSLVAKEVDSSNGGVEIMRDLLDLSKGQRVGEAEREGYAYWAHNGNDYAVQISIRLFETHNALDGLAREPVFVAPQGTSYLGSVFQAQLGESYTWSYRWEATPTEKPHGKAFSPHSKKKNLTGMCSPGRPVSPGEDWPPHEHIP